MADETQDTSSGPLDADYARTLVDHAAKLDRVQRMLPMLPREFVDVVEKQSIDFLYGIATAVQAIHDLIGNDALDDASRLVEVEEENLSAMRMAKVTIGTFGLMEAMGFVACKEIIRRHEQS